jgi:hypothetical protein
VPSDGLPEIRGAICRPANPGLLLSAFGVIRHRRSAPEVDHKSHSIRAIEVEGS